eukprot:gene354-600_t
MRDRVARFLLAAPVFVYSGQAPPKFYLVNSTQNVAVTDWTGAKKEPISEIGFTDVGGSRCQHNDLPVAHAVWPEVSAHRCWAKCRPGEACAGDLLGDDCHCQGFNDVHDLPNSNALCVSESQCENLCRNLENCYAFETTSYDDTLTAHRCYLKGRGCQAAVESNALLSDADWDFHVKTLTYITAADDTCMLGYGLSIASSTGSVDFDSLVGESLGVYNLQLSTGDESDSDASQFDMRNYPNDYRVVWDSYHCGYKIEKRLVTESTRRLDAINGDFAEVVYLFDPSLSTGSCSKTQLSERLASVPDFDYEAALPSHTAFDVFGYRFPLPDLSISYVCPESTGWVTVADRFCPRHHLHFDTTSSLHQDLCMVKCSAPGIDASGNADVECNGFTDDMGKILHDGWPGYPVVLHEYQSSSFVHALCMTRERCEAACAENESCTSFDMHQVTNQCYLNTEQCMVSVTDGQLNQDTLDGAYTTLQWQHDDNFDIVAWQENLERSTWVTHSNQVCSGLVEGAVYETSRSSCEEICTDDDTCVAISYANGHVCTLYTGTVTDTCWTATTDTVHTAIKISRPTCFISVTGAPDATANGRYDETGAGIASNFVNEVDSTWEIEWKGTANECLGWVVTHDGDDIYQTFAADSHPNDLVADTSLVSLFELTACTTASSTTDSDLSYLSNSIWRSSPKEIDNYSVTKLCRDANRCTVNSHCAVSDGRLEEEMSLLRGSYSRKDRFGVLASDVLAGIFAGDEFSLEDCTGCTKSNPTSFPKVLSSENRLEAVVDPTTYVYGKEIQRRPSTATPLMLLEVASAIQMVVLTASSADVEWSEYNFGRTYPQQTGYQPWVSDVIRLEGLSGDDTAVVTEESTISFVFYYNLPTPPVVFFFPNDLSDPTIVAATKLNGTESDYWYIVTTNTPSAGDFVGTDDCSEKETCIKALGGFTCVCTAPEYYTTPDGTCAPNTWSPTDTTVVLEHSEKLTNGWKVSEVSFYERITANRKCDTSSLIYQIPDITTSPSSSTTDKSMLVDYNFDTFWASALKRVDPWHSTGAYMSFVFDGEYAPPQCVRITQLCENESFADKLYVSLGLEEDLPLTCGEAGQKYWGEKLDWKTSAEFTACRLITTSCQCQQACIDNIEYGCQSWQFFNDNGRTQCILQSNVFDPSDNVPTKASSKKTRGVGNGSGWWRKPHSATGEYPLWYSGIIGPVVTSFYTVPASPRAGEEFSVHLSGVGLPDADVNGIKKDRQTMKIVGEHQHCRTDVPSSLISGSACTDNIHCIPRRESGSDSNSVSFKGFKIEVTSSESKYTVCYCAETCHEERHWNVVPGTIDFNAAVYTGEVVLSGDVVSRKSGSFGLTVTRPPFSGSASSNVDNWSVKLVSEYNTCSSTADGHFTVSSSSPLSLDEASFNVDITNTVFHGKFIICFDPTGTDNYEPLPTTGGDTSSMLVVEELAEDTIVYSGFFHKQYLSAQSGTPMSLSLEGRGLISPSFDKVGLTSSSEGCSQQVRFQPFNTISASSSLLDRKGFKSFWIEDRFWIVGGVDSSGAAVLDFAWWTSTGGWQPIPNLQLSIDINDECAWGTSETAGNGDTIDSIYYTNTLDGDVRAHRFNLADGTVTTEVIAMVGNLFDAVSASSCVSDGNTVSIFGTSATDDTDTMFQVPADSTTDITVTSSTTNVPSIALSATCSLSDEISLTVCVGGSNTDGSLSDVITFSTNLVDWYTATLPLALLHSAIVFSADNTNVAFITGGEVADGTAVDSIFKLTHSSNTMTVETVSQPDGLGNAFSGHAVFSTGDDNFVLIVNVNTYTSHIGRYGTDGGVFIIESGMTSSDHQDLELNMASGLDGRYTMCHCNAQDDSTLSGSAGDVSRFRQASQKGSDEASKSDLTSTEQDDLCYNKCHAGCQSSTCNCDGYESSMDSDSNVLCLTSDQCRQLVEDNLSRFSGYNIHKTLPQCTLTTSSATSVDIDFDHWDIVAAEAQCGDDDKYAQDDIYDFSTNSIEEEVKIELGTVMVTAVADVGFEYVVEPHTDTSIEITGNNLNAEEDRIMVIDCQGSCGSAGATVAVNITTDRFVWPYLAPVYNWRDGPWHDRAEIIANEGEEVAGDYIYRTYQYKLCPGNNLPTADTPDLWDVLRPHLCYYKCFVNAAQAGSDPTCGGFMTTFDDPMSKALCVTHTEALELCSSLEECHGIEESTEHFAADGVSFRHYLNGIADFQTDVSVVLCNVMVAARAWRKWKKRYTNPSPVKDLETNQGSSFILRRGRHHTSPCTIHGMDAGCLSYLNTHDSTLENEDKYHFHWKYRQGLLTDANVPSARRRLDETQPRANDYCDPYSASDRLLFNGFQFRTGGKFKVCYCDSSQLVAGEYCNHPSRFSIDVGYVHSSGLQCLIENPSLQRSTCSQQCYG